MGGSIEPSTREDVVDQRMHVEPDQEALGARIYFDAYPIDRTAGGLADVNPNVAALGSHHLPPVAMGVTAWLGVWKDCNRDGYVGHVETLAIDYRAELLLDDGICPPGSRHNRFSWVTEFVYISPQPQNATASFPRVVWDPHAKVWGDFGRPQAEGERYFGCAEPLPRGALESTGALLGAIDCHLGHQVARQVQDSDGVLGLVPTFDGEGGPYHPENDCDHPLNVHLGVHGGDPCAPDDPGLLAGSADPMFAVWDCSTNDGTGAIRVPDPFDPFDSSKFWFYVGVPPSPTMPSVDEEGSLYMGADALLAQCDRNTRATGLGEELVSPTHPGTTPADAKRSSDFLFVYDMPGDSVGTTPTNLGLRGVDRDGLDRGAWNADRTYRAPTYHANLVRGSDLQGHAAQWFTFYAEVGTLVLGSELRLPQATPGFYGAEPCGDATSSVILGWDCDPERWWSEEAGGVERPTAPRPGSVYYLRDTDCYDGEVAEGTGVYASGWLFTGDATCPLAG